MTPFPKGNPWAVSQALLAAHLGGSDTAAIGGELAYNYARTGNTGMPDMAAQAMLATPEFGRQQAFSI